MRNVTALEFARLYSDLLLVETLPREEVAAKLREIADLIESKPPKLVLHEAYSMEAVNETTVLVRLYFCTSISTLKRGSLRRSTPRGELKPELKPESGIETC